MSTQRPSAIITGGSRGIGYGIAAHLAVRGWSLTLAARNAEQLKKAQTCLEQLGGDVQIIAIDMADDSAAQTIVDHHADAFESANALIMAAGVGSAAPLENYPMRRFDKQLAVNLRAPFALTTHALPLLRRGAAARPQHGGRVIALASMEGVYPEVGLSAYGASKAALISLMQSINAEEGQHGITASAISPGYVDTDMSAWIADTIAPDKMITVADIVKVVDLMVTLSPNAVVPHLVINRVGSSAYHA